MCVGICFYICDKLEFKARFTKEKDVDFRPGRKRSLNFDVCLATYKEEEEEGARTKVDFFPSPSRVRCSLLFCSTQSVCLASSSVVAAAVLRAQKKVDPLLYIFPREKMMLGDDEERGGGGRREGS